MKKFLLIALVFIMITDAAAGQDNQMRAKIVVVNLADTTLTHVYGNRWYSTTFDKDIFNYYHETVNGLNNLMLASNIGVTTAEAPGFINRMALLNLVGKPTKDMIRWFENLKQDRDIDFVVIITRKFEPENKISHRYLNGKQYGIGTYTKYPDAISMFSFVGYYIFDTRTHEEIKINKNHDQYILTDLRLNHRMTFRELKDLPKKYIDLTVDKMTQIVNTRNVEIKRALLEHLNR